MFDTQDQLNYPVNNPTCPQLGGARDARGARVDVVKARRVLGMTKAFNANLAMCHVTWGELLDRYRILTDSHLLTASIILNIVSHS